MKRIALVALLLISSVLAQSLNVINFTDGTQRVSLINFGSILDGSVQVVDTNTQKLLIGADSLVVKLGVQEATYNNIPYKLSALPSLYLKEFFVPKQDLYNLFIDKKLGTLEKPKVEVVQPRTLGEPVIVKLPPKSDLPQNNPVPSPARPSDSNQKFQYSYVNTNFNWSKFQNGTVEKITSPFTDEFVVAACRGLILTLVNSPRTAIFEDSPNPITIYTDDTRGYKGTIDAQNGYGGLVRSSYYCYFRREGEYVRYTYDSGSR